MFLLPVQSSHKVKITTEALLILKLTLQTFVWKRAKSESLLSWSYGIKPPLGNNFKGKFSLGTGCLLKWETLNTIKIGLSAEKPELGSTSLPHTSFLKPQSPSSRWSVYHHNLQIIGGDLPGQKWKTWFIFDGPWNNFFFSCHFWSCSREWALFSQCCFQEGTIFMFSILLLPFPPIPAE